MMPLFIESQKVGFVLITNENRLMRTDSVSIGQNIIEIHAIKPSEC